MILEWPEKLMFLKNSYASQKQSSESMKGKLCVISGATSGVGYEAIKALAAGNATIVMIVRNEKKARAVKKEIENRFGVSADYFIADFNDLNQVENAVRRLVKKYPKVDVLINSAGLYSTKKIINENGCERVFCVNHLASFLITQLLVENLIESAPARIIQVNSEGHRFNGFNIHDLNWENRIYTGLRSYGASKTAQLLTVRQFAEELKGTGVTINAMHPGAVKTNIGSNNGRFYRWFSHHIIWPFLKDPKISGEAIYYLASAKELRDVSGVFFNLTIEEEPAAHVYDPVNQRMIWDISLKLTGLK